MVLMVRVLYAKIILQKPRVHKKWVDMVMEDLHLNCSKKMCVPGQRDVFLGTVLDTHVGSIWITDEKLWKLMLSLQALMLWDEASPRDISSMKS